MHTLRLIDHTTRQEVAARPMRPEERYTLYQCCADHALYAMNGKQYTVHTVAWQIPAQDCVASVSFHSDEPWPSSVES